MIVYVPVGSCPGVGGVGVGLTSRRRSRAAGQLRAGGGRLPSVRARPSWRQKCKERHQPLGEWQQKCKKRHQPLGEWQQKCKERQCLSLTTAPQRSRSQGFSHWKEEWRRPPVPATSLVFTAPLAMREAHPHGSLAGPGLIHAGARHSGARRAVLTCPSVGPKR